MTTGGRVTVATGGVSGARVGGLAEVGDVVAGYRLEALAGHGGMGVVYRAREPELGRSVALKLIAPERAQDPRFRELFVRESLAAASLEHPNVIPIYRAGDDEGRLFIAMRYVEGSTLRDEITRSGRLAPGRAARLVAQVAAALDAARARGLIHRDVKPANVLLAPVGDEEHVYLSDFGVSVAAPPEAGADGGVAVSPGRFAGTPSYLAPEQIRGEAVGPRADVYALGCVLFEALTGRVPFSGADEAAVLEAHLGQTPARVSDLAPDVPPGFDEVLATALAKRPEDRHPSAGALARAALALRYDALVLHHADDGPAAREMAAGLARAGLQARSVRADSADVREDLRAANACVLLIGPRGLGPWAREALSAAADLAASDRGFRVVAGLLPGAPERTDPGLAFLASWPLVDLREGTTDPDAAPRIGRALRSAPPPPAARAEDRECPYRGLDAFDEEHARFFVGREQDVERLVEHLGEGRFLAVVAPSGFGKSSLVRAGLVPALRAGALPGSDAWPIAVMSPGGRPLAALAAALRALLPAAPRLDAERLGAHAGALDDTVSDALAGQPDDARAVLVVDQFEEVFTLCQDPSERTAFLDAVCRAATIPGGRLVVLLAMRADFYARCAEHPRLRALVSDHQYLVGPLGPAELRRIIEEPARRAGLELEPGLARTVLEDVADRPGALPLLEHLLLELWSRREGRTLTLDAYAASGGVEGALAKRADASYAELGADDRETARRVLLRLVQPGEGTEDTRRVAQLRELVGEPGEQGRVEAVVAALAAARLLTTGRDPATGESTVEIAHEALIRAWPALRGWVNDDRESLRLHRHLTDASGEWERSGRDEGALYRGARLAAWQERSREGLNPLEREFLEASRARAERERGAARRRVRIAIAALAGGLAIVAVLAILAFVSRQDAADQRDLAQSRQLAAVAGEQLEADPELSTLLALEAMEIAPTPAAERALRQATYESAIRASHDLHDGGVSAAAFLRDGDRVVSVGEDGRALVWDRGGGAPPTAITGHSGSVLAVATSRDGRIATAGEDGTVRVTDATGGNAVTLRGHEGSVDAVSFRPDGGALATGGADGTVRVWRVNGQPLRVLRGHEGGVHGVAFGPGGVVASGADDGTVRVWRTRGRGPETVLTGHEAQVFSVAVSPDGQRVASGGGDATARIWTLASPGSRPVVVRASEFSQSNGVAFTSDGRGVATAGADGGVRVWDLTGRRLAFLPGHAGTVTSVDFSSDGRLLVSAGADGTVRVWEWGHHVADDFTSPVELPFTGGVSFAPDGRRVQVVRVDGALQVWDPSTGVARTLIPGGPLGTTAAAVAPDGKRLATGSPEGTIRVAHVGDREAPVTLRGHEGPVWSVDFSPDGARIASGGNDGTVRLWDMDGDTGTVLEGHSGPVFVARYAPDGRRVVSAGVDGTVRVWDTEGTPTPTVLEGHEGIVLDADLSPDGRRAVSSGEDRTIRLYELAEDRSTVLGAHQDTAWTARFSVDGRRVLSSGEDGLRVWDWQGGREVLVLGNLAGGAPRAVLSPDGLRIASHGVGDQVRVSSCETCGSLADVIALARERTTRELSEEEKRTFAVGGG